MEDSKDIQRTDNISSFIDNQSIRVNPFGRNSSVERAYRRAERICAALHLVTNHVPIEEPVRTNIRSFSILLLSKFLSLRNEMRAATSVVFQDTQSVIRELISLVRVLSISGHISSQNAVTLCEALDELGNFLVVSQRSGLAEPVSFSKDELLGSEGLGAPSVSRRSSQDVSTAHRDPHEKGVKDSIKDILKTSSDLLNNGHLDRRGLAVLDILRSQGTIGIKDIATSLPEYSEKMIQRELAKLVSLDRVKKVGFKRWSKYALII